MREIVESGAFIALVFLLVLFLPSAWLIRRWRARRHKERDLAELFGRPYSGPATSQFQFESTHRDLLDAHAASQPLGTGDRLVLISLGLFWLGCVVVFGRRSLKDGTWWKALLMLGLGITVIWFNLVKPFVERRRIRTEHASTQSVSLMFSDSAIHIESPGLSSLDRTWDELLGFELADKGIAMSFRDTNNWIPNRAFSSEEQKREFAALLMSKLRQNQPEELE